MIAAPHPETVTKRSAIAAHALEVLRVMGEHYARGFCPYSEGTEHYREWIATVEYALQAEVAEGSAA